MNIATDPRFTQPWHGVPRAEVDWHPTIDPVLCMGCGLCVTSCGRSVFRYDYEARKAVVTGPDQCMVGCVTCANTCPETAIAFPSLSSLRRLVRERRVLQRVKRVELIDRDRFGLPVPTIDAATPSFAD